MKHEVAVVLQNREVDGWLKTSASVVKFKEVCHQERMSRGLTVTVEVPRLQSRWRMRSHMGDTHIQDKSDKTTSNSYV
jgi:hypothetical protein